MPSNDQYDWLTYESLFNKPQFRKPNGAFKLGLYLIPLNKVTVWIRDSLDATLLAKLADAFFPDLEQSQLLDLAKTFWPWKKSDGNGRWETYDQAPFFIYTPREVLGNRGEMVVHLDPCVVMPYNFYDNGPASHALGTENSEGELRQIQEGQSHPWFGWKTASRSCVMRTARTKPRGGRWGDLVGTTWSDWRFDESHRKSDDPAQSAPGDPSSGGAFSLASRQPSDFSVKTGVQYVGKEDQGQGAHKDVIGDWLLGCLRSDYIAMIDQKWKPPADSLLVLTELLTITEQRVRTHKYKDSLRYKEGVQIRDISTLDPDKIYFPPLSIPFVDPEFREKKDQYECLKPGGDQNTAKLWRDLWKRCWAAALGRAKALFLLRYGLQHVNPNPQNYLIEFPRDGFPEQLLEKVRENHPIPVRIVIRDLNDASLHREIVWAWFGGSELPPQRPDEAKRLAELDSPLFKFEFEQMPTMGFDYQDWQETGSTPEASFGPPGTQLLWQRFSAFTNGDKIVHESQKDPAYGPVWQQLLVTLADWGVAHNKSYISCLEEQLGLNFLDINWAKVADPERYATLTDVNKASEHFLVCEYRSEPDKGPFLVKGAAMNQLPASGVWQKTFPNDPEVAHSQYPADEIKKHEGKPCLWIMGNGFHKKAVVTMGDQVANNEEVFWVAPNKLYVEKTDRLKDAVEGVIKKKVSITVTNPGSSPSSARLIPAVSESRPGDLGWEEMSAKVIHTYLSSQEGQEALRAYRKGGFRPLAARSVVIRIVGAARKGIPWRPVTIRNARTDHTWTDLTNEQGEIRIFRGSKEDFEVVKVFNKVGGTQEDHDAKPEIQ